MKHVTLGNSYSMHAANGSAMCWTSMGSQLAVIRLAMELFEGEPNDAGKVIRVESF